MYVMVHCFSKNMHTSVTDMHIFYLLTKILEYCFEAYHTGSLIIILKHITQAHYQLLINVFNFFNSFNPAIKGPIRLSVVLIKDLSNHDLHQVLHRCSKATLEMERRRGYEYRFSLIIYVILCHL